MTHVNWNHSYEYSVKHDYEGQWDENTRLTTCDPHARKLVSGSESPQEVEENKEIIFTYDVEFQVGFIIHGTWITPGCNWELGFDVDFYFNFLNIL